jgi:copper(I)-binding protein
VKRAALAVVLVLIAACGDDDPELGDAVMVDGFAVSAAWTRPTPPGRAEAAIYVTIENRGSDDDRLIGSESDRCMVMHPHLTSIGDDGVASMVTADGDQLALPRSGSLQLVPNGLHLMCLGLAEPLVVGDTFEIELRFSVHEPLTVPVVVDQR